MNKVTYANAVPIAIPAGYHNIQVVIGEFDAFGNGDRPPVQAVNAISVNESRQV
jgi:hypothetical protein